MKKVFDNACFLGYVNQVSPQGVRIHFPSSKLLNNFRYEGTLFNGANVGDFVVIEGVRYGFLARIVDLSLPDSERKSIDEKSIHESESIFHPIATAELLLSFDLYCPDKLEKTVAHFPPIGAKVFACSENLLKDYIKSFGAQDDECCNIYAEIGSLSSHRLPCNVSINSIFNRHCAIVGTTGGGKSWTVARLIENILEKTNDKIILIDATGEYNNQSFLNSVVGIDSYFDCKYLSNADFCLLFQESSPNTVAALCDAIHSLKLRSLVPKEFSGQKIGMPQRDIQKLIHSHIHEFTNMTFDLSCLPQQIENECVRINNKGIYEQDSFKLGYCSHLIARVNLFLCNNVFTNALGINKKTEAKDIIDVIKEFLKSDKQILRLGFENLPFDFSVREVIVDLIAGHLLKEARTRIFCEHPLLLFIDEAHQFTNKRINADDATSFSLKNIDSIAKECRKYGLFLCLATQMPRDIPIGTLSQIGTFIVHRLINDQDRKTIENACSSASRTSLALLPVLGAGEALLLGVDFPMPLTLKIKAPIHRPNSKTPVLSKAQKQ